MSTTAQATEQTGMVKSQTSPLITELAVAWKMTAATMINTLKATIFPQKDRDGKPVVVSDAQLVAFLQVCSEYHLNPFVKEIYAFPTKGGGIVPMVPIDGWANIVNRNEHMDGVEFVDEWETNDGKKTLVSTTCIIHRKDRKYPTRVTEYLQECYQSTKEPWIKWPARMLRHKAFIQCARIAFALAGIYDPDEAERIAESESTKPEPISRPSRIVEGSVVTHTNGRDVSHEVEAPVQVQASDPVESKSQTPEPDGDQPTADDLFPKPGAAEKPTEKTAYVSDGQLKKLLAVARGVGIEVKKDSKEDALHKLLKERFNIESLREIPESIYAEVLRLTGGDKLAIK